MIPVQKLYFKIGGGGGLLLKVGGSGITQNRGMELPGITKKNRVQGIPSLDMKGAQGGAMTTPPTPVVGVWIVHYMEKVRRHMAAHHASMITDASMHSAPTHPRCVDFSTCVGILWYKN